MNDPFDALRADPAQPSSRADRPDAAFRQALLAEVRRRVGDASGDATDTSGARWRDTHTTTDTDPTELVPMPTSPSRRARLLVVAACVILAFVGAVAVTAIVRDNEPSPTVDRPAATTTIAPTTTDATTTTPATADTTAPPTAPPSSAPATTKPDAAVGVALTAVDDGLIEFDGGDIVGEIASGFGSVWVGTMEGLIEIDASTFEGTWYRGVAPGRYVASGFDSVWVANGDAGTVTRIDPETKAVIATIDVAGPYGIAVRGDTVDVTQVSLGTVTRIDPVTNTVAAVVDVVTPASDGPRQPAVVDDELWFAVPNVSKIAQVDAADGVSLIDVPGLVGRAVPVITDDAVWIAAGADPLTRVDRTSGVAQMVDVPSELEPDGTVAGFVLNDTVWFVTSGEVVAIDDTGTVLGSVERRGRLVRDAVVTDEWVWIVSEGTPSIERIAVSAFQDAVGP